MKGKKLTTKEFINKCTTIHDGKYIYNKVIYISATNKVVIICSIHGEFEQMAKSHMQKHGCPECAKIIQQNSRKSDKVSFVRKVQKVHNNKYDYSLVDYKNNNTKVQIKCPEHGIFEQTPR